MSGKTSMDLFHKASGWPKMSAGMAGFVNPIMWLEESDLAPDEGELLYYSSLMEIVLPYHSQELKAFLVGNQPSLDYMAYEALCANVSCKVESIITELETEVKDYWKI